MMRRRDLLIAGLGLAAAGAAEALKPRRKLMLLRGGTIAQGVPATFGSWTAEGSDSLVSPDQAGRLSKTLYSEIVQRIYSDQATGVTVMLLAAYGDTQSDLLQLHRPESCYPAVGFNIESSVPASVKLSGGPLLPVRRVVATAAGRRENIIYWTRIGEELPLSGKEQRQVRLENAMHGFVGDGILVRCSMVGESAPSFAVLEAFIPALLAATARQTRPALIGTRITKLTA
jgi:EpsI family protein